MNRIPSLRNPPFRAQLYHHPSISQYLERKRQSDLLAERLKARQKPRPPQEPRQPKAAPQRPSKVAVFEGPGDKPSKLPRSPRSPRPPSSTRPPGSPRPGIKRRLKGDAMPASIEEVRRALVEDSPGQTEDGAAAAEFGEAEMATVSSAAFGDVAVPTDEGVAETVKSLSPILEVAMADEPPDVSVTAQYTPEPFNAVSDAVDNEASGAKPEQQQQQQQTSAVGLEADESSEHNSTLIAISDSVVDNVGGGEKARRPSSPSYFRKVSATKLRRYTSRQISVVTPDLQVSRSMLDLLQV